MTHEHIGQQVIIEIHNLIVMFGFNINPINLYEL